MTKQQSRMLISQCVEMGLRLDLRHYPDGRIEAVAIYGDTAGWFGSVETYESALAQAQMTLRNDRQ